MLICHISTTFNIRSGFAKRTLIIINELINQGHHVLLIIGKDNDISKINGVNIIVIPELIKKISLLNDLIALLKIRNIIKKYQPDIVHTHLAKGGVLGRVASRNIHCKVLHTVHGPTFPATISPFKKIVYLYLERFAAKYTDYFVFVGYDLQEEYIKNNVSSQSNSCVIYTARSTQQLNYKKLTNDKKKLLREELVGNVQSNLPIMTYVGRVVSSKQQDHAIDILKILHTKYKIKASLLIVGKALLKSEKKYERYLEKKTKELSLKKFVFFIGYRDDILEIMNASNSIILPSSYEGLPNVIVEAVLSETPIVSYNVSGVKEILHKLNTELIVEQGDINGMAQVLSKTLFYKIDINYPYQLIKNKLKVDFSEKNMLQKKISLYKKIG